MSEDYSFFEKAGRYMTIIFAIWCIVYALDRWVFKTKILVNCCSLLIALLSCLVFEIIFGWMLELD